MNEVPIAESVEEIHPDVFRWRAYSPHHRVELTSHALSYAGILNVFDPIGLGERSRRNLQGALGKIRIFLTSENHYRATDCWRRDCDAEVFALQPAGFNDVTNLDAGARNFGGFEWRALDGGPAGEVAYVFAGGRLAFGGDAVVNLPGRGLEVLPDKYCSDRRTLRDALQGLADIDFLFPAHGGAVGPQAGRLIAELQ